MSSKLTFAKRFNYSLNPKMYINLIGDKFIKVIMYLFIIAIIVGGFNGINLVNEISAQQRDLESRLSTEDFEFIFKDGILDFKNSPYTQQEGQTILIVDTNMNMEDLDLLRSTTVHKELSTIFFRDGMVVKSGATEIEYLYKDSLLGDSDITNNTLLEVLDTASGVKFIIIPIIIIATFIELIIYAFIISTMGLISTMLNRQRVPYGTIFKLSIYAMTIPALINFVFNIYNVSIMIGGITLILALRNILNDPITYNKEN